MDVTSLREHFGLSQLQLANWLNVHVGQIRMGETGQRKISNVRNGTYELLDKIAEAGPVTPEQIPPAFLAREYTTVNNTLKGDMIDAYLLQVRQKKRLAKMKKEYQQALNLYAALQFKKKIMRFAPLPDWLKNLSDKTDRQLQEYGLHAQALLQMQIDITQYTLQKAQELEQQLQMPHPGL